MDLLCLRCAEPYELYYVRYEMTPEEHERFLTGRGCPCCQDREAIELSERQQSAVEVQASLLTILGNDLDGLAAEMEDLGLV